jgi:tetratricopeptide (TPR) repeat protein
MQKATVNSSVTVKKTQSEDGTLTKQAIIGYVEPSVDSFFVDTYQKKVIEDEVIDMTFISHLKPIDISGDGGVLKFIDGKIEDSIPGSVGLPQEHSRVRILFEFRSESGELINKERNKKQESSFSLFHGHEIQGLHVAVATMKKLETSWFKFQLNYHFGTNGLATKSDIYCKVHLIDFTSPKENVTMLQTIEELFQYYEKAKAQGTEAFREKDFMKAFKEYSTAANTTLGIPKRLKEGISEEQQTKLNEFIVALNNNSALAAIQLKRFETGVKFSTVTLNLDKTNARALYRRARCNMELGNLREANIDLQLCNSRSPGDKDVVNAINELRIKLNASKSQQKTTYAGFFDKLRVEEKKEKKLNKLNDESTNANNSNCILSQDTLEVFSQTTEDPKKILDLLQKGIVMDKKDMLELDEDSDNLAYV